jgi:hypothetical protein
MIALLLRRYIKYHPKFRYKRWKWANANADYETQMRETKQTVLKAHSAFIWRQRIETYLITKLVRLNVIFDKPIYYCLCILALYRVFKNTLRKTLPQLFIANHVSSADSRTTIDKQTADKRHE